jgi:hypothetical protein
MKNSATCAELKKSIQSLEIEQANQLIILKDQFNIIYESLQPLNMIKATLKKAVTSHNFKEEILDTSIGLTTGYLSRLVWVGTFGNPLLRFLGTMVQFGISNIVATHPDIIKKTGLRLLKNMFTRRKTLPG